MQAALSCEQCSCGLLLVCRQQGVLCQLLRRLSSWRRCCLSKPQSLLLQTRLATRYSARRLASLGLTLRHCYTHEAPGSKAKHRESRDAGKRYAGLLVVAVGDSAAAGAAVRRS